MLNVYLSLHVCEINHVYKMSFRSLYTVDLVLTHNVLPTEHCKTIN